MAGRDLVQSLWQALIGDYSGGPADTFFSFERPFYPAIGHLIMGHQIAMHLELSIMSVLLSGPQSHKIGCVQQQSTIKWRW